MKFSIIASIASILISSSVFASAQMDYLSFKNVETPRAPVKAVEIQMLDLSKGMGGEATPVVTFILDGEECELPKPTADAMGINLFDFAKLADPKNTSDSIVIECDQLTSDGIAQLTSILLF
jgi:hypothetical protein